ncbi:MAG: hypothetical protein RI930_410, partial [Pseudomonadota bacterium]
KQLFINFGKCIAACFILILIEYIYFSITKLKINWYIEQCIFGFTIGWLLIPSKEYKECKKCEKYKNQIKERDEAIKQMKETTKQALERSSHDFKCKQMYKAFFDNLNNNVLNIYFTEGLCNDPSIYLSEQEIEELKIKLERIFKIIAQKIWHLDDFLKKQSEFLQKQLENKTEYNNENNN